jgi:bifunctional ADP-heptose synthase (sugar kinase/adenylyltransferase)
MKDVYYEGWAKDISAEAPIVRVQVYPSREMVYPGGAANVEKLLTDAGISVDCGFGEGCPVKCRVIADGHQVARFDLHDECKPIILPPNINLEDCRAIVVSDYCKGSIDKNILAFLKDIESIPIFVDTKRNPEEYPEYAYFFPNQKEYEQFSGYKKLPKNQVIYKHGHSGLHYNGVWSVYLAEKVESVVGAGDVVLAAFIYAKLNCRDYQHCADFASYAGTRKVECPRTEAPPLKEMFESWKNITNENK